MQNFSHYENVSIDGQEKLTLSQIWNNHPPAMNWYLGLTCLSFGFIYMLLFTML